LFRASCVDVKELMQRLQFAAILSLVFMCSDLAAANESLLLPSKGSHGPYRLMASNVTYDAESIGKTEPPSGATDRPASSAPTPDKPTSIERARIALAESSAEPLSHEDLCSTLVQVARENELPLAFFANLIWRESRFDFDAISPAGAMGIAQFMPDVADTLDLDAFDARAALPASGQLLRTLYKRFGNLGLAAAAYNAGPKRVSDWRSRRSALPRETRNYVQIITGRSADDWQRSKSKGVFRVATQMPCRDTEDFVIAEQEQRLAQARLASAEVRPQGRSTHARVAKGRAEPRRVAAGRGKVLTRVARSHDKKRKPLRLASVRTR
jgi:Transglycosylase SLT domain